MHINFREWVVWITGASSGIGQAVAVEMAQKGAHLILSSRRIEALKNTQEKCLAENPNAQIKILPLDVAASETLESAVQVAIQCFGKIDILINNAGIAQYSLIKTTELAVHRRMMEVDYFGAISLTKYLIPHFLERKKGHFVVVSSVMGYISTPQRAGYAAAKHALHGYYDALRAELWRDCNNIHVTLICPGFVQTNVSLNSLTSSGEKLNKISSDIHHGMTAKSCAKKIVVGIHKQKKEVFMGGFQEVAAVYVKRWFPALFEFIIRHKRF